MEEKIKYVLKGEVASEEFDCGLAHLEKFLTIFDHSVGEEALSEIKIEVRTLSDKRSNKNYEIKIMLLENGNLYHAKKVGWIYPIVLRDALDSIKSQLNLD